MEHRGRDPIGRQEVKLGLVTNGSSAVSGTVTTNAEADQVRGGGFGHLAPSSGWITCVPTRQ